MDKLDYLIISAHPDDEVIGCSSIVLKEDKKVGVIHMTSSHDADRDSVIPKLGLDYYHSAGHKFFTLKCCPIIIDEITDYISNLKPRFVLGHYECDYHQDHQELAKALNIALRANRNEVEGYFQYYIEKPFDLENCLFLNVDKQEKKKLLKNYRKYINCHHFETIIKFNEFCGTYASMGFAEPFKIKYMKSHV